MTVEEFDSHFLKPLLENCDGISVNRWITDHSVAAIVTDRDSGKECGFGELLNDPDGETIESRLHNRVAWVKTTIDKVRHPHMSLVYSAIPR